MPKNNPVKTMQAKEKFNLGSLAQNDGCFDLQFRKDTRHERTGSPTYYRWKIQFIITLPKTGLLALKKAAATLRCGSVTATGNQARFSAQKIDDIIESIIPYFTTNKLSGAKKSEFSLWQKAANIIYKNKGVYLSKWQKNDLLHLMEIHKAMAKYKQKPRKSKHADMAEALTRKS